MRRDNRSELAGLRHLRYGWADIVDHPCQVAVQQLPAMQASEDVEDAGNLAAHQRFGPALVAVPNVGVEIAVPRVFERETVENGPARPDQRPLASPSRVQKLLGIFAIAAAFFALINAFWLYFAHLPQCHFRRCSPLRLPPITMRPALRQHIFQLFPLLFIKAARRREMFANAGHFLTALGTFFWQKAV